MSPTPPNPLPPSPKILLHPACPPAHKPALHPAVTPSLSSCHSVHHLATTDAVPAGSCFNPKQLRCASKTTPDGSNKAGPVVQFTTYVSLGVGGCLGGQMVTGVAVGMRPERWGRAMLHVSPTQGCAIIAGVKTKPT